MSSSSLRALSKHTRSLSRTLQATTSLKTIQTRAFHSPFAVLNTSSVASPPPHPSTTSPLFYEKQQDHSTEPPADPNRTYYVVSEPDPAHTPYEVPSGAYPTSAPYQNPAATEAPPTGKPRSSTSSSFAHPYLSTAAPERR